MPEPALIFDYGNVIAFFDYMYAFERLGARMGVSGEVFRQRVVAGGFPDFLAEFESGRIAPEEFATAITAICGLDIPYPEFVEAWKDIFRLNESVAELIKALKWRRIPIAARLQHQCAACDALSPPICRIRSTCSTT